MKPIDRTRLLALVLLVAPATATAAASADEGMWLFNKPPTEQLQMRYGFTPTAAWLEHLQKSCVRFSTGGSGSIVSSKGLVMTNHHVGAEMLYKLSTADHDLLEEGFWARTPEEELLCPDLELLSTWEIVDVTGRVEAAAASAANPAAAAEARRKEMSAIEKESFDATGMKSDVVTLYQGGRYHLYRYKRYTDVRLVFAPEKQAAFFGGDPDNFEYPRYDLDCSFFRIWEDGKPLTPTHFLEWNADGCAEGDLVFVAGHPGRTERLYTADHLEYLRDVRFPLTLARLWRREVQLEVFSDRSEEWRRIAEDEYFGIQNSRKAYTGMIAGLQDPALMEAKRATDRRLQEFVAADSDRAARWGGAWSQIAGAQDVMREMYRHYVCAYAVDSELYGVARTLVRAAAERPKPSDERLREYNDAALPSLEFQLFSPAPVHVDLEVERMASSLSLMHEWLGWDDPMTRTALAGRSPRARAEEVVRGTALADVAARRALWDGGADAVAASTDPMIQLARALDPEARALRKRYEDEVEGPQQDGYAKIAAAKFELEGEGVYPDATFTLRLAFGTVKGYEENGHHVEPFTHLEGLYRRSAERGGMPPFDIAQRWMDAKDRLDLSTPFDFVSTCDIIGGNSGSPVVDRDGKVVGLIFDGNIQSLTLDIAYTDVQARAVSVDARAMIEAMRVVYDAGPLADEILGKRP